MTTETHWTHQTTESPGHANHGNPESDKHVVNDTSGLAPGNPAFNAMEDYNNSAGSAGAANNFREQAGNSSDSSWAGTAATGSSWEMNNHSSNSYEAVTASVDYLRDVKTQANSQPTVNAGTDGDFSKKVKNSTDVDVEVSNSTDFNTGVNMFQDLNSRNASLISSESFNISSCYDKGVNNSKHSSSDVMSSVNNSEHSRTVMNSSTHSNTEVNNFTHPNIDVKSDTKANGFTQSDMGWNNFSHNFENTTTRKIDSAHSDTEVNNTTHLTRTVNNFTPTIQPPNRSTPRRGEINNSTDSNVLNNTKHNATGPSEPTNPVTMGTTKQGMVTMELVQKMTTVFPIASIAVCTLGIALNIPSILVFSNMSPSISNGFMKILIFLDTISLVLNLPMALVEIVHDNFVFLPLPYHFLSLYLGLVVVLGTRHVIFVVTTLMSVHRCMTMSFLTKLKLSRNPLNHPGKVTGVVTFLAFCVAIPGLTFDFDENDDDDGNNNSTLAQIIFTKSHLNDKVLLVGNIVFRFITLPLMLVANILLVVSLVQHARSTRAAGIDDVGTAQRGANMMRSVRMVLVYSVVFLLLALPVPIYTIVEAIMPEIFIWEPALPLLLKPVLPFLGVISSSANFFVFFAVSSQFRTGFRALVGKCCK